jgi:hypothetical protein
MTFPTFRCSSCSVRSATLQHSAGAAGHVLAPPRPGHSAITRNALADGEPVVVVVLGGGHDLAASVRAADPHCGYLLFLGVIAEAGGGQDVQRRVLGPPSGRQATRRLSV